MTFKKRATKIIALALVGITVVTPMLNSASAMEQNSEEMYSTILSNNGVSESELIEAKNTRDNFTEDTSSEEYFSDEQIKLIKVEFQERYGIEDKFNITEENSETRTEVNGARGIIRVTDLKTNEVDTLNYFETLNKLNIENSISVYAPSRPSGMKTQAPDKAYMSVTKGSSRDSIKVRNPLTGTQKSYTKPTNNWYSGYTKGYYDNVVNARRSWGTAKNYAGNSAAAALTAVGTHYISKKNLSPSISTFSAYFKATAAGVAIYDLYNASRYGVAYLANIAVLLNNYNNI